MRIALFHATLPQAGKKPGGVDVAVHGLANALAESDEDEVTVYSLTECPPGARYRHRRLFPRLPWLNHWLARLFVLPALLNFAPFEGDVVHLHGDDWFYFRRPLPTVRTLHGSALREAQAATRRALRFLFYVLYALERLSARLCRRVIVLGPGTARLYPTRGQPVREISGVGIDGGLFRPGAKSKEMTVLFVGTWGGRKRGSFIFDVFTRRVLPVFPNARLCMVSDFCPDHPAVTAETRPTDDALAQRFRESWVFAYPSTYEGFGIPYLEALASGTAVLSSPNEGVDYVLDGGRYGEIASDEDFGDRLIDILSSKERREELGRRGLARAERFSWKAVAERHREIYRQVLNR